MKRILTLSTLAIALAAATPHGFADRHKKKAEPAGGGYWIGVACRPVDVELARELDIPEGKGMVIYHVIPGGPAARADLEKGDVIVEADGKPVTDIADLKEIIEDSGGKKIPLLLIRDGKKKKMHIAPARRMAAGTGARRDTGRYRLGIYCAPASPALRDRLELGKNEGLVVEKVREDSPAAEAGIRARDVLVKAGGRTLERVPDLVAAVQKSKGGRLKIEIRRGDKKKTVTVRPEKVAGRDTRRPERPQPPAGPTRYWLGVSCREAGEVLRQQLQLGDSGLVVEKTADDSPAGKAGIEANDVLIEAGGRTLKAVEDLVAAVGDSGGKALKITLIRRGRKKEIEATPGKRPPGFGFRPTKKPFPFRGRMGDPERWKEWIEKMRKFRSEDAKDNLRLRFFHPPTLVPGGKVKTPNLPKGVSVAITKAGNEPATIVVRKGDKKWEVTEDNLDELPDDVRPHVERIMGGIHISVGGVGGRELDFAPNMKFFIRKHLKHRDKSRKKAEKDRKEQREDREDLEELKERVREMQEEMRRKTEELRRAIEEMEQGEND